MNTAPKISQLTAVTRSAALLALLAALCTGLTGCFVAGYSSGGGWFIWPGSLSLLLVLLLIVWLIRR